MRSAWQWILALAMSTMIVFSFITDAPQQNIGESSRIFYYHIPQAWICVIAFIISAIYSAKFLKSKNLLDDDRAVNAARLGFMFCILATVTGSIFAKVTWGSFWNWDPRETSIFILLLIYAAYFALRGAMDEEHKRAQLASVYSIMASITVPFLVFVVPRITPSLHPEDSIIDENMKFTMSPEVRMIFFSSLIIFTVIFIWMFKLDNRISFLERFQKEKEA